MNVWEGMWVDGKVDGHVGGQMFVWEGRLGV